jgi:hypothetical protein
MGNDGFVTPRTAADVGADASGTAASAVSAHASVSTSVHGIVDTSKLAKSDVTNIFTNGQVIAHTAGLIFMKNATFPIAQGGQIGWDSQSIYIEAGNWPDDAPDLVNFGLNGPHRIWFHTNKDPINDATGPYYNFGIPAAAIADPGFHIEYFGGARTGAIFSIGPGYPGTGNVLELNASGNLILQTVTPVTTNAYQLGDATHGYKKLVLHDGTDEWEVTVNTSGALVTTKV